VSTNIAFFTFIAGGGAAGGTLVYALVSSKPRKTSTTQVFPWIGAGIAGLGVAGHW
jgi:hypothetical protein